MDSPSRIHCLAEIPPSWIKTSAHIPPTHSNLRQETGKKSGWDRPLIGGNFNRSDQGLLFVGSQIWFRQSKFLGAPWNSPFQFRRVFRMPLPSKSRDRCSTCSTAVFTFGCSLDLDGPSFWMFPPSWWSLHLDVPSVPTSAGAGHSGESGLGVEKARIFHTRPRME